MAAPPSRLLWWALSLAMACHPGNVESLGGSSTSIVQLARERQVPNPMKAKFAIKLKSDPLGIAGSTTGGLVVDRPGRGRIEIFGLIGGTLATIAGDGAGLAIVIPSQKRYYSALDAEKVMREATNESAGMDDVLALLVGDFPMDSARIDSVENAGVDGFRVKMRGPSKTTLGVWLDADRATLRRVVANNEKGEELLTAEYAPYELQDGIWFPSEVVLTVPALELTVELRYKSWSALENAPAVFSVPVPEGFVVEPLETVIAGFSANVPAK